MCTGGLGKDFGLRNVYFYRSLLFILFNPMPKHVKTQLYKWSPEGFIWFFSKNNF